MMRTWESKLWQQMSVDAQLARGYKTCLRGSVLWVLLVALNLWANHLDTRVAWQRMLSSASGLRGLPDIAVAITNLLVIGITILFAALLYSGRGWIRWILLAQGVFSFLVQIGNILRYGPQYYIFGSLLAMPYALMAWRYLAALVVPPLLLGLFAWMRSTAPRHYYRQLAAIKRESISLPESP